MASTKRSTSPLTATDRKLTRALNQLFKALLGEDEQVRDAAVINLRRLGHPHVMDMVVARLLRKLLHGLWLLDRWRLHFVG